MNNTNTFYETVSNINGKLADAKKVMSFTQEVTAIQAQYWLDKHNYPYNRPINRRQVEILKTAINSNQFNEGSAIHFGILNGKEYLLDGQHRLTAIVETGVTQPMTIVYGQVESFDEMAHIYARFDRHLKRTAGDTYAAFNLTEITGLQRKQISKADNAIRLILAKFSFTAKDKMAYITDFEIMEQIKYYQDYIKKYYELISGCDSKILEALVRRSTLSVALVTLDEATRFISSDKVYEFWQRVADGDKLEKNHPCFYLRNKLLTTRIRGSKDSVLEPLSMIDACRIVVLSWNNYIDKKQMIKVRMPDWTIPIKLTSHTIPVRKQ